MFNYKEWAKQFQQANFFDTNAEYPQLNIKVDPAQVKPGQWYFKAIGAKHLNREDGGGKTNIFLCALDNTGKVLNAKNGTIMKFGWDWVGRRPDEQHPPVFGDKPDNEPPAHLSLGKNQLVSVAVIAPDTPSDVVRNLRTDWPDWVYHTPTFVCWKLTKAGEEPTPPTPEPPAPEPGDEFDQGFQAGRTATLNAIKRFLDTL